MCQMDEFGNWQGVDHFGNPHDLPNGDGVDTCLECGKPLSECEEEVCLDCENMGPDYGDEPDLEDRYYGDEYPDVDESQEWHDFDPDC